MGLVHRGIMRYYKLTAIQTSSERPELVGGEMDAWDENSSALVFLFCILPCYLIRRAYNSLRSKLADMRRELNWSK